MRVRHVVSGRYLHVKENMQLGLCESTYASCSSTLFALYSAKEEDESNWDLMQEPNQGQPCIKYNEHPVYIKHVNSQSWLSHAVIDSKVPGKISGKRVVLLPDGHSDDAFFIRVSQYEESLASRFIMKALKFFNRFIVALKSLSPVDSEAEIWSICSVDVVTHLIEDLIAYFAPPEEDADHEEKQATLKNLKVRQDLFQSEGFILVIREMVDCLKEYKEHFSAASTGGGGGIGGGGLGGMQPGGVGGPLAPGGVGQADEVGGGAPSTQVPLEDLEQFDEISSLLFELLASLIRGNHENCSKFSEPASLDWLMSRLHFAHKQDALDVLYCLLQSSPEAVNIFTETHIKILLNMIDKFGKDYKVLDVMRTLCVSQNEAVRANQNSFLQHFTANAKSNLTFQTKITEQIVNVRPNAFIGMAEGSAMYYKWYFEVHVENILRYPHTHLRVGWASTSGFTPYSTRGTAGLGGNGVGDDMFSWGFDGKNLWTDGSSYAVQGTRSLFQYDDVIGCCIDFTVPRISFTLNGIPVLGVVESFPVFDQGLFHPVASMSSLIQIRFVLGGKHGSFAYKPPEGYAPVCELVTSPESPIAPLPSSPTTPTEPAIPPNSSFGSSDRLMSHCVSMSTQDSNEEPNQHSIVLHGPCLLPTVTAFHPQPVDLQKVNLNQAVLRLRVLMAEWFHEQWSISKIEAGWIYGEQGIDEHRRYHDCLKPFAKLNEDQQYVEIMTADEIIRTVLALGYTIKPMDNRKSHQPKRINLPNNYVLSNGYKPAPYDIAIVQLGPVMSKLVELLAENTHNIWAEAKIARSWTHGAQDSASMKRTPLLTEYKNLDPVARKGVRNSAVEAIKLIVVLGYRIEAPIVDVSENMLSRKPPIVPEYRVYRADYSRSVSKGKLYYEFEPLTHGYMMLGWAHKGVSASKLPACDPTAFLFNGYKGEKQNEMGEKFGKVWSKGDIVGCFIDIEQRSIGFSLNGQMMMDVTGRESAFDHFDIAGGIVPVFCLARGERAKVNFGNDPNSLRFYFANAYHQGFMPLCFEHKHPLPLWVSLRTPHFRNVESDESSGGSASGSGSGVGGVSGKASFKATKTTSTSNDGSIFPAIKMTWEGLLSEKSFSKARGHFLRLNLPVHVTGNMPTRPGFLTELEISNAAISASKNTNWGYSGGGTGGQFSGPVAENTIMEESEEDPDLNRPPIEYSKIRKKQDPTSLLALFQPSSSKGNSKMTTAANLKLLQTKQREQPVIEPPHSDDEDSEEEPSFVIGFADESLKKIMKTSLRGINSETRPYKPSVVGLPHLFTPGVSVLQKNQKKFEELFNFDQNGSCYQFSVRVYQGQDTSSMLIGWASSGFSGQGIPGTPSPNSADFSQADRNSGRDLMESTARNCYIKVFDNNGGAKVYQRRNLYMASVTNLCAEAFPSPTGSSGNQSGGLGGPGSAGGGAGALNNALTGLQIDVLLDVRTGMVTFCVNRQSCSTRFQIESGQTLFPCVYVKPTCKDTLQFEFTRSLSALPLSCAWMGPDLLTNFYPECPPSLSVQVNDSASWLALPEHSFEAAFINAADKGWRVLTDIPYKFCSLLDRTTGRSFDILELSEREDWLMYHCKTLELYSSMCKLGNHRAAHILTEIIDEKQFLFLIQCNRLPGLLRLEVFNLLIAMHFQYRTDALLSTSDEFIFTLDNDQMSSLPDLETKEIEVDLSNISFPNLIQPDIESVLPMSDAPKNFNYAKLGPPKINSDELKHVVLKAMEQSLPPAGEKCFQQQDPPGGSHSYFLVPCLKLTNCLLLNGLLSVSEMQKLVAILDPHLLNKKDTGTPNLSRRKSRVNSLTTALMSAGLIYLELDEMAKHELIKLMTYLKNSELRQIIGQLVMFANNFVGEGQFDQRRRYIDITTNTEDDITTSVLAMKTKEFRCKPLEQMKSMLSYRTIEKPFSPCRKDLQDLLHKFHSSLLEQIGVNTTSSVKEQPEESTPGGKQKENDDSVFMAEVEDAKESRASRLMNWLLFWRRNADEEEVEILMGCKGTAFRDTVVSILVEWAKNSDMQDASFIQSLFLLLFRQYDEINHLMRGLDKTYVVGGECELNVKKLLTSLCTLRQLLNVSMGPDEEKTMIDAISEMTFNTVFYQHPELIRKLNAHESVMTVMVNIMSSSITSSTSSGGINSASSPSAVNDRSPRSERGGGGGDDGKRDGPGSGVPGLTGRSTERRNSAASGLEGPPNEWNSEIVSSCCRFLSFFCRTSSQNQKAVFEKLDFLLDNITMGLAYPSLRGSTPLDVAAASMKNNEELALALRQHHLESVIKCLGDCGLASNSILLARGVADIGWDPVVGERLLDFLKTTVWVSGESVEQNAFQIVRMLVRRPECLGPALRAGGRGLLEAVAEAIDLQKTHNAILYPATASSGSEGKSGDEREGGSESVGGHLDDPSSASWTDDRSLIMIGSAAVAGGDNISMRKDQISFKSGPHSVVMFNLEPTPDDVQIGDAVLDFYSALINLLGCCSPGDDSSKFSDSKPSEPVHTTSAGGGGETQRVRAILQSLVPMEDLEGILGMTFSLPSIEILQQESHENSATTADEATLSKHWVGPLKPHHKAAIVKFWDRVYGINDSETLQQLISIGFLPDLRTAVILDTASVAGTDFSVALNRYICQTVLPLLTRNARLFEGAAESDPNLVETFLITIYRFFRCRTLSNAQRAIVNSFLSCVIQFVKPQTIHNLLLTLSRQLADLESYNEVVYEALSTFLQHNQDYYSGIENPTNSIIGVVSEEERSVLLRMFETFFEALIKNGDIDLIDKGMPALLSIVGTIPPDYLNKSVETLTIKNRKKSSVDPKTGQYIPRSSNFDSINLSKDLAEFTLKYSEQVHDEWSKELLESGWTYGLKFDDDNKKAPNLKPFKLLHDTDIEEYKMIIRQKLRIVLSLGFQVEKKFNPNTDPGQGGNTGMSGGGGRGRKVSNSSGGAPQVAAPPSIANFRPNPLDLSSVALTNELIDLANLVGECCHDLANNAMINDSHRRNRAVEHTFVPYELLTLEEKSKEWKASHNFIKFLIVCGFQVTKSSESDFGSDSSLASPTLNQKRFSLILLEKVMVIAERASKAIKDSKAVASLVEGSAASQTSTPVPEIVGKFAHVVIPVIHHYVFLHRTYYTGTKESSSNRPSDHAPSVALRTTRVYASVREKELLLGLFCRLFASMREQKNSRNSEIRSGFQGYIDCIKAVAEALEFSAIAGSSNPTVLGLVHIFFLSVVNEMKTFREQMTSLADPTALTVKETRDLKFMFKTVLPVLKLMLRRIGSRDMYGKSIIVGETQYCCYELLEQLYLLGADQNLCNATQRGIVGDCLAEFAKAFPVAFLEPEMTIYNKQSILNNKDFKQRLENLCVDVPTLDEILNEVNIMASSAAAHAQNSPVVEECYDPLLVIEVLLPITCIYFSNWIYKGPDYELVEATNYPTNVTHSQQNGLLCNVLSLITNNFGVSDSIWMMKIAKVTQPIWRESTSSMLNSHYLPALRLLAAEMDNLVSEEARLKTEWQSGKDTTNSEDDLQQAMMLLMRDIYCFFPFLLAFMEQERLNWNSQMPPEVFEVFELVTKIFACWAKSQTIRREESNFVTTNCVDTMAFISGLQTSAATAAHDVILTDRKTCLMRRAIRKLRHKKKKKQMVEVQNFQTSMSLIMVACKRMVPIGLAYLNADMQEIIQNAKQKYLEKAVDEEVKSFIKNSFTQFKKDTGTVVPEKFIHIKSSFDDFGEDNVLHISKVLQRLHFVDHPPLENKEAETKLLSKARKRSVMQCFQMVPIYTLPRHKAVNLFIKSYQDSWLSTEEPAGKETLIESLTTGDCVDSNKRDPLTQLVMFFKRGAQTLEEETGGEGGSDDGAELLYISYAELMSNSCSCQEDDEEGEDEGGAEPTFEEQEMAKQKLLSEQARLKDRGAAEMILLSITKCTGVQSEVAEVTLQLGISVLTGGNEDVQTTMLNHLMEKKDVSFFNSVAGFMQSCSVLNLDSFERCNKAEDQGSSSASSGGDSASRVMDDASFTTKLFRFLQLLCEGHNADWQNYLRVQEGNTSSVNLINASVDYLVRLQESMSDFYWHYSSIEGIDTRGREAFMVAILVGKQVFASLTEMIQGPCTGNQLALTHSRLWDAVSGFFHLFANLQLKLSQDPEQMEFLRELMDLQKEMVTLLLSMLEGNVLNGPIGKQMVDTLALCSQNVQDVLQFFTTFLKYSEMVAGVAFQDYDLNGDGIISPAEFRKVLQSQKVYSEEQMNFLVECADKDSDGRISYKEFSERFSDPASEIGFNIALLFTNLSEHTTNDARLEKLVEAASDLVDMFEDQLGRIEILGGTKRIERVYFEISEENKSSWEAETIKESKREFLFSGVVGMPDMEKLETFINFCEDTIYEMQHTRSLNPEQTDSSLPPGTSLSKRLLLWSWDLTKRGAKALILSPWTFLLFLIRLIFFFILKLPYFISIKLPYLLMRLVVWKPVKTVLRLGRYILYTVPRNCLVKTYKKLYKVFRIAALLHKLGYGDPPTEKHAQFSGSPTLSPEGLARGESNTNLGLGTGESRVRNRLSTSVNQYEPQSPPTTVNEGDSESIAEDLMSLTQKISTTVANQEPSSSNLPAYMDLYESWLKDRKDMSDLFNYDNSFASNSKQDKEDSEAVAAASKAKNQRSLPNRIMCLLARNYYRIKALGAVLSFFINIILLFCRISVYLPESANQSDGATPAPGGDLDASDTEPVELVTMGDDVAFLEPVLVFLSVLHAFIALLILLAYYKLKVPLVIFQREKEVSRKLEFEGLYLTTQPEWNDFRAKLDSLVISSRSFPMNFWDKFVKKRAKSKYSEAVGEEEIDVILGTQDATSSTAASSTPGGTSAAQPSSGGGGGGTPDGSSGGSDKSGGNSNSSGILANYDYQYNLWKFGVIFSDQAFLYIFFYFLFSIAGNFSRFFFAIHLMDIAFGNKDLSAILRSVTHNGKQLVLTALLTSIVIYLYTVVAFNFFRDSYIEEAENAVSDVIAPTIGFLVNDTASATQGVLGGGSDDHATGVVSSESGSGSMEQQKCANMWQCFIFHLHHGLRAGGGIGDEIEDPDGQELMYMRIIFDMTFFFFVIVILLAIIQGLIIDAFGELRGQLEQTKEDLENKCFICGLGKEYFDEQAAHGFEIHSEKEHNFANYMFFLMYLINKDETEFTGQETYVWNLYQARNFDFFPLGDCFRKQYEEELKN
ncbi:ryanodine receptor 2-like isoform X3 [Convolutriloba macropyga]|uniref:ryanodine receptor 2-like isoform X3 n=1 Tax=Convolutriloba macropyga TaxID=536237 RepID=UPI003F51E452